MAVNNTVDRLFQIFYKEYSENILGYMALIRSEKILVINSLFRHTADAICDKLTKLISDNPDCDFILLQADGQAQFLTNLNLEEMAQHE